MSANGKESQSAGNCEWKKLVVSFSDLLQSAIAVTLGGLGFDTLWPLVSKGGHYLLIVLFAIFMLTFIVVSANKMYKMSLLCSHR